jgi:Ca2+-binding RTX toxin-like protein
MNTLEDGLTNLVIDGSFNGSDYWTGNGYAVTDGLNQVLVTEAGEPWSKNLSGEVSLVPGDDYTLAFDASGSNGRSIIAGIGQNADPWLNHSQIIVLTEEPQTFVLHLTAQANYAPYDWFGDESSRVLFDMGADIGRVEIDNVSLTAGHTGTATSLGSQDVSNETSDQEQEPQVSEGDGSEIEENESSDSSVNQETESEQRIIESITLEDGSVVSITLPHINDVLDYAEQVDQMDDEIWYEGVLPGYTGSSYFSNGNYILEPQVITNQATLALVYSGERYSDVWGFSNGNSMIRIYDTDGNQISGEIIFSDQTDQGHRPGAFPIDEDSYLLMFQTNSPIGMPRLEDMVGYVVGRVIDSNTFEMKDTFVIASDVNLLVDPPSITRGANGEIEISWNEYDLSGEHLGSSFTKFGGDISDQVFGSENADFLYGFDGDDQIDGLGGNDVIDGGNGSDVLEGGDGDDIVDGGVGDDLIIGGNGLGDDAYFGGSGIDTIKYTSATAGIAVDLDSGSVSSRSSDDASIGSDTLEGIENVIAGFYNDLIIDNQSSNKIETLGGNDDVHLSDGSDWWVDGNDSTNGDQDSVRLSSSVQWEAGFYAQNVDQNNSIGSNNIFSLTGKMRFSDVLDGGSGQDTLNLTDAGDAFFLHDSYSSFHSELALSRDAEGRDSYVRLISIEIINAGGGDDLVDLTSEDYGLASLDMTLNGEAGNDILWAAQGDDTLDGGAGDDMLNGSAGDDILTGGSGSDIFEFTATSGNDTITDFNKDEDELHFYFREGEAEESAVASINNGIVTWDAVTVDLGDPSLALSDLNISYEMV